MPTVVDLEEVGTLSFRRTSGTLAPAIDLGELGSLGSAIIGEHAHNQLGLSVSAAGDVNGDGIDDVIIGGSETYVIFGQAGGIGEIDLDDLQPSDGFEIEGHDYGLVVEVFASGAGDINGDGFDDIIVGGYQYGVIADYGSVPNAFVIFGKADEVDEINVDDFLHSATSDGFRIFGEFAFDYSGARVASAGDFNGDGFDDIIVGTPFRDAATGAAYVIFGKSGGFANIDLENLDPATGFAIIGDSPSDELGWSVSDAGDVNGDGFDDIILAAPYGNRGGANAGQAYVIFGRETGFGTIDLSDELDPDVGFMIEGHVTYSGAVRSVSGAGDVNGDGFDDIILGVPYALGNVDEGFTEGAGEAYVIFGKADGFGTIDLFSRLKPKDGFTIKGDEAGGRLGWSVSEAGDLNADGFDDVIVGAPGGDGGGEDAGEAYVIFGQAHGLRTIDVGELEQGRGRADGFIIQGDVANDRAGWSVAGAGDVDDDGIDDLVVGAPWNDLGAIGEPPIGSPTAPEDLNSGQAYILYGAQLDEVWNPLHDQGQDLASLRSDLLW